MNELFIKQFFSEKGELSQSIEDYRLRQEQVDISVLIDEAITNKKKLIVEAGTGIGKTFAYLVPAFLSGGKIIISTATKNLQDQLFTKDIPMIRDALNVPVTLAMLKGRSNYLCHLRLENAMIEGAFMTKEDVTYLHLVNQHAKHSMDGDRSELDTIPESSSIWPQVTSTKENCLGQDCSFYKECFVMNARKKALTADVTIVNHHLFFADLNMKEEGISELLPKATTVIFDEAHQIPDIASIFFGKNVSTAQISEIVQDGYQIYLKHMKDVSDFETILNDLEKANKDFRLVFPRESNRYPYQKISTFSQFDSAYENLIEKLKTLIQLLAHHKDRDTEIEKYFDSSNEIISNFDNWRDDKDNNSIKWVEVYSQSVQLNNTPLSIADMFAKHINNELTSWIFTSATLAVKNNFDHFKSQLGLTDADSVSKESPFNYAEKALLFVPKLMPDANHENFNFAVVNQIYPFIKASKGRAFILCTTLKSMREIFTLLQDKIETDQLDYPIYLQGDGSRNHLLNKFREHGHAVLIGSLSFWEGVDVKGDALSLVVIDKLPFFSPEDPVLAARIDKINKSGKNAFMEYQLPNAVITLKQGAGRLIRDEFDKGVLVICDTRIIEKAYGKRMWQSLPPFARSRDDLEVIQFLEKI
ncbi:ATP-dependent DNA helicase [Candidatus Methylopumilus planktonicus]|uniref:ATP-dependent DNA helicase n=1 Tax=Candidatus Methylopumilus planktonicus TaxID=1581557 RepID=UPI003BEF1985